MVIKVTNRRDVSTIHPLDSLGILQVMMLVITMVVATVVEPDSLLRGLLHCQRYVHEFGKVCWVIKCV